MSFPPIEFNHDRDVTPLAEPVEFPKWVEPHPSHIVLQGNHIATPAFSENHVQRGTQKVTVLVQNVEEERRAFDPWEGLEKAAGAIGIAVDLL